MIKNKMSRFFMVHCVCKVFKHCLLDRLKKFLASADNQFGFKKGVGCNHAIYTVRKIVDKLVSNGYTANLCTLESP